MELYEILTKQLNTIKEQKKEIEKLEKEKIELLKKNIKISQEAHNYFKLDIKELKKDLFTSAIQINKVKERQIFSNLTSDSYVYSRGEGRYRDKDFGKICSVDIKQEWEQFFDKYQLTFEWKIPNVEVKPSYSENQVKEKIKELKEEEGKYGK